MFIGSAIGSCIFLIFGIIGTVMLIKYFRDKKKAEESQNWSSTPGIITESYVRKEENRDSDGYPTTSYYPEVRYAYEFLGTKYTGDKIAFGESVGGSLKKAQDALAQYPVGKNMAVYYDPNNPEDAVLERRVSGKMMLIIGIIFLLVSFCTVCIGSIITVANLGEF